MSFTVQEDYFYLNSRKVFLNSGEIHYFRIKRELWEKHIVAAKEAGLNTISAYVPWAWHEANEGEFDFDGKTCPEKDLNGWLQLCQNHGLKCIVKPGPFILAEFRGAGLPNWFVEKYEDKVKMRNSKGEKVMSDGVNLFSPIYLEKVGLWFDNIMPLISGHQLSEGGSIIMMQLCNEIGVFSWLAHQADYGYGVKERFISYLKSKYKSIQEINKLWGQNYNNFTDLELPPDGHTPYQSSGDRSRDYEWHCFWRTYYGDYLRMLFEMVRERGVTVPLYHNLPGWIYGHGFDFPLNITMYEDLYGEKSDIIFGIDHIPEFVSYRNMHDDRAINDITRAMQGKKPLFAAEFQSGSREYHVVPNPKEMELFYKASIANGLTGWNYYMFSQGKNPTRKGYSGDTFYWFTPLTADGERTSAFPLVKKMSKILNTTESLILNAQRKAEVCVLFYPPYYATELERPEEGASNLQFVPATIRRPAYFDGLIKVLQLLNIDYDMADLTQTNGKELGKYKQVWVFSTDEMNANEQQTVVDYVKLGGNTVLFPNLPYREMNQNPCNIIRNALQITPTGHEIIDSPLIDILGFSDVKCANPQMAYSDDSLADAEIIARTLKGTACGFEKRLGKGKVLHIGTWLGFDTEGHKPVYEAILNRLGGKLRQTTTSNNNIAIRQRFTDDKKAILFIGNYFNQEQLGKVHYTHPTTGDLISIPISGDEMLWPALYAVLSPICMNLVKGISILHSTSDILEVDVAKNQVKLTLQGDRDLKGEMVFEGDNISQIKSVLIDDVSVSLHYASSRLTVNYNHIHNQELTLTLKIG